MPATASTDGDSTDPLLAAGAYEERLTPLWTSAGGELEQVEVWSAAGRSDGFLRYSLREDGPRADALRSLWLSLPDQQTGFRDLLLREGYALAASFMLPDDCLSVLVPGVPGLDGVLR